MTTSLMPQRLTKRAFAVLILHAVVFAGVYWFAFSLRNEFAIAKEDWITLWFTLPAFVILKSIVFYYFGQCHRSWYSVSFSDLIGLFHAANLSTVLLLAINGLMAQNLHPPRTVFFMDWALTILVLGALRAIARASREELSPRL